MIAFAQITLLNYAVDIVAVRPVAGFEVLADRDKGSARHAYSIAPIIRIGEGESAVSALRRKIVLWQLSFERRFHWQRQSTM